MLVRFRQGRFAVLFCALHAPHRAHERELTDSWWTETRAILAKHRRRDPLIIAGDMNASLGSVTSPLVSDWAPETEDAAGAHLHALLKACECWLPCTFAEVQQGPTTTYRQKRNLRWCRPDFVAIPSDWATAVRAWTEPSVHVACSGIDHIATCVSAGPILALPGTFAPRARPRLDPQLFTDPARREVILGVLKSSPPVSWQVSAHAHAAIVVDHIQQSLAKICKRGKGRPTHVYLTDATWQLQRWVSHLKRSLSTLQQRCKTSLTAFVFSAWRTRHLVSADPSPWAGAWANRALVMSVLHLYHIRVDSKRLRQACKRDRDAYVSSLADQLATCPSSEAHAALHRVLCHKRKKAYAPEPLPMVRTQEGEVCEDAEAAQDRWREYFSAMEAGECFSVPGLADRLLQTMPHAWPMPETISLLPGMPDLVRLMISSKQGKAAGMDGLPNELLRHYAPEAAKILHPLLMKLLFRGTEAIGLKGGLAVWFHKGKGTKDLCESYRQILLLSGFAKVLHQAVRPAIREVFLESTPTLQLGGKPGQSVCFGAHMVRSFLRYNLRAKRSCFVLFTDIATAFYSVVRQLVAAQGDSGSQGSHCLTLCAKA